MSKTPENLLSLTSEGSLHNVQETTCEYSRTSSVAESSDCLTSKKRKRNASASLTLLPNLWVSKGQFPDEEISNIGITGNSCNMQTDHVAAQCLEASTLVKRIRTINKNELNILRVQIAMISDVDGDRPIHVAVAQEDIKLVQKLCTLMLKASISLDLTNYLRQTPLHLAVMLGNTELVTLLLNHGSCITLRDRNGNSVLHLAVKTEARKNMLNLILSQPGTQTVLNSLDYEGYSALHYAALKDNKTAVRCFHSAGAQMNIVDGKSGRSALVHAILDQNADMVSLLLECGACAEVVDYSGRSAFEFVLHCSNKRITKLLEKKLFARGTFPVEDLKNTLDNASNSASKRTRSERIMKKNSKKRSTFGTT